MLVLGEREALHLFLSLIQILLLISFDPPFVGGRVFAEGRFPITYGRNGEEKMSLDRRACLSAHK